MLRSYSGVPLYLLCCCCCMCRIVCAILCDNLYNYPNLCLAHTENFAAKMKAIWLYKIECDILVAQKFPDELFSTVVEKQTIPVPLVVDTKFLFKHYANTWIQNSYFFVVRGIFKKNSNKIIVVYLCIIYLIQ